MSSYKVGFGKPPRATRFQKGNREHLKRSKPTVPQEGRLFRKVMAATVAVPKNGKFTYESRMQLAVNNFIASAVRGDIGAADMLIQMHAKFQEFGDMNPIVFEMEYGDQFL